MRFWGLTDLGCVRQQNEDALHVEQLNKNAILCVVCDGMGGAKSGNVASSLAADTFVNEIKRVWKTRKKTPVEIFCRIPCGNKGIGIHNLNTVVDVFYLVF
jgi:serine/threonine protein phosphatase PrpC